MHTAVSLHLDWTNFWRLDCALPGVGGTVFRHRAFVLHRLRAAYRAHHATLRRGPARWIAGLSCLGAVVELCRRAEHHLFAAVVVALAGVAWAAPGKRLASICLALALLLLLALNLRSMLIDVVYAKGMKRIIPTYQRWNAISRVEVDEQGTAKAIVIDADAQTYLMNTEPHHWSDDYRHNLMSAPASLANVLRPLGDYAIIGPGGGVDVLRAVANGSPNVTGIEINPIIANDIMRDRFADYTYHLYDLPEVHMHVSDGRSFIRNSRDRYDVIEMTLVDTWASTAAGAFALSENNLYTVEAFREYFEHLKPDGMIAITRWEFAKPREALRVVSQAMEALQQMGVENSEQNFIVVSDGPLDTDGRPVVVLAKKSPFTPEEQRAVLDHIQGKNEDRANLNLNVLYLPITADQLGMAHPAFAKLIRGQDAHAFSAEYPYNVSPVTDNAPFFFFTLKPEQVFRGADAGGIDWKVNLGIAILGVVLLVSIAAVIAFLVVPLALSPKPAPEAAFACSTSSRSALATFWWRSPSSNASCCSWDIRRTR